jgi:TRAP-type mannitol/chloroaromatic compound transport system substrate-binding protein
LRRLHDEGVVKIRRFDDAALKAFYQISRDVLGKIGSGDELSGRIHASYMDFQRVIGGWTAISESSFLAVRSAITA